MVIEGTFGQLRSFGDRLHRRGVKAALLNNFNEVSRIAFRVASGV